MRVQVLLQPSTCRHSPAAAVKVDVGASDALITRVDIQTYSAISPQYFYFLFSPLHDFVAIGLYYKREGLRSFLQLEV